MIPQPSLLTAGTRQITGETPTGSGTTFTLAHTPKSGTLEFFINGLLLKPGTGAGQYAISGRTVTTVTTYDSDAEVLANYKW